ncbi:MAG: hypothetical protein RL368_173 [Pseudomonadota bacterium]|jgi:uncharacterized membrane protein YhaH (DUF805 family)
MSAEPTHIFSPKGRIGRLKYANYFFLHLGALIILLNLMMPWAYGIERLEAKLGISSIILTPILLVFSLYCVIVLIILSIRRLHDINLGGWWLLFCLIPKVHIALGLLLISIPGTPDANYFGAPPTINHGVVKIWGGLSILILLWIFGVI